MHVFTTVKGVTKTDILCAVIKQNAHTGCIKLNKREIAHRLCKASQCTKFFIEIGCLGTDNVV